MWCESHPSSPIRIVCPCTDAMWPNDVCHRYLKFKPVWPCSMCIHYNMLISKPHRADLRYIHACMGFKHHDLLFKYLNSTLHWLWPHLVFYTHTVVFSFIIVPLTFSRAGMHTQYQSALSIAHMQTFSSGEYPMHAHTHTPRPLHHIGHSLSLTCMCNDRCSSKWFKLMNWPSS